MTITLVNTSTATPAYGSSVSVTTPASVVAGDLLVVAVGSDEPTNTDLNMVTAGWTSLISNVVPGSERYDIRMWYRYATGSSHDVQINMSNSASAFFRAIYSAFRGDIDTSASLLTVVAGAYGNPGAGAVNTEVVAPSVTPTRASLLVCAFLHSNQASALSTPSGMISAGDAVTSALALKLAYQEVAAGATGTRTSTASGSSSNRAAISATFSSPALGGSRMMV